MTRRVQFLMDADGMAQATVMRATSRDMCRCRTSIDTVTYLQAPPLVDRHVLLGFV
jgi:hypothetical protein